MEHKSKIVDVKPSSDGALAVRVRCCGDETTDSWLTIENAHQLDEAGIEREVLSHQASVEARHQGRDRAEAHALRIMERQSQ